MKRTKIIEFDISKSEISHAIKAYLLNNEEISSDEQVFSISYEVGVVSSDDYDDLGGYPSYEFKNAIVKFERKY